MAKITSTTAAVQRAILNIKDRLAGVSINAIVSHAELRQLVPDSLTTLSHYVLVQRAQRLLNAENGSVFATVRGEGYRRLAHVTGADYASNLALLRVRRQSQRGIKITTFAIEFANDASDDDRRRVYQKLGTLGMIEHLSYRKPRPSKSPNETPDSLADLRNMLQGTRQAS